MILGLDVSTSITGFAVIDDCKILLSGFWDTRNKRKFPCLYTKAQFLKQGLSEIREKYNITNVFIEQSLQSFRSGFSSAQTISTLSRFNGIISWMCYETYNIEPQLIAATSARKNAGLTIRRGENAKQKVFEFVLDKYPQVKVEYTKHGNPKPGSYDETDAIIIALAGEHDSARKSTTT